jgi:pyridine nucleotide-disulfide oxidoreductase
MVNNNPGSPDEAGPRKSRTPRVVIVGGAFGGLAAAKALHKAPTRNILIDRTNHHLLQPLLYQVATTSVLSPSQISSPIRGILRKQKNTTVIMGEVTGVDKAQRCVFANGADREHVAMPYDYLILATGVRHSYFGHNEFEKFAPGIKSLADAVAVRSKILSAFEQAEAEENVALHRESAAHGSLWRTTHRTRFECVLLRPIPELHLRRQAAPFQAGDMKLISVALRHTAAHLERSIGWQ